jgi:hypothetical protein
VLQRNKNARADTSKSQLLEHPLGSFVIQHDAADRPVSFFGDFLRQHSGHQTTVPLLHMLLFRLEHPRMTERVFQHPRHHFVGTLQKNSIPTVRFDELTQITIGTWKLMRPCRIHLLRGARFQFSHANLRRTPEIHHCLKQPHLLPRDILHSKLACLLRGNRIKKTRTIHLLHQILILDELIYSRHVLLVDGIKQNPPFVVLYPTGFHQSSVKRGTVVVQREDENVARTELHRS